MITVEGYTKTNDKPDGIAITWKVKEDADGKKMNQIVTWFKHVLAKEDGVFHQRLMKMPAQEFLYVYIIIDQKVMYRCNYVGCRNNYIQLAGPLVEAPFELIKPGFRNFRYTTKLF